MKKIWSVTLIISLNVEWYDIFMINIKGRKYPEAVDMNWEAFIYFKSRFFDKLIKNHDFLLNLEKTKIMVLAITILIQKMISPSMLLWIKDDETPNWSDIEGSF